MNCWRRFRALRIGAASLVLMSACGSAFAQTRDVPHSTLSMSPPLLVSCALCGTRWQVPTFVPPASWPAMSTMSRGDRLESRRDPKLDRGSRLDAFQDLTFRDNEPLVNRLKRIQAVALVTVWDSTSATLYVGVNRDGEPGLHLRQKKHDRGTLAPASRTLFSDVTPWRAAMIAGQRAR